METRRLLSSFVVTSATDGTGPNSLRWAITQADSSGSASEITFDISSSGPVTIELESVLPVISVPITIDGTTEPGFSGTPLVEIDGSGLTGTGNDGLVLTGGDSTVRGLSVVGFSDSAIVIATNGGDSISGNYLGLTPSGVQAVANQQGLTLVDASSNTIGSGTAGPGNVISGNSGDGILLEGSGGSSDNIIDGNLVGTTADGTQAVANGGAGIAIEGGSQNDIGLVGQGFGNLISGNDGPGISLTDDAAGDVIDNNVIGLAANGQTPLGNQEDGIDLDDAPQTLVGGPQTGAGNVIAANQGNGIDTAGDTAGLWIAGNDIGTDITGQLQLGNVLNGINLASSSNLVGGTVAGAANVIDFNGSGRVGAGVQLDGMVDGDTILSNSIYENAGLGINLGSGPTPNHQPGTPGPNDYQNYPVITSVTSNGTSTTINGTLYSVPLESYDLQFFSSPRADASGFGEGQTYLGSVSVATNSQGDATFSTSVPVSTSAGAFISATATGGSGDTSEFCETVQVQGQINLILSGTATPSPVIAGDPLTYSYTVANEGVLDAQSVVFTDQLPPGVTVSSVSFSQGNVAPTMTGGEVVVDLGTVDSGSSATVAITVQTQADAAGTFSDVASITSQEADPNSAAESVTLADSYETAADVGVTLTEGPSAPLAGGVLTYVMIAANAGPESASNVVLTLPVSAGLSYVSSSSTAGSVSFDNGQVVAQLGDVAANAQDSVTVVLEATTAGTVTETATATSSSVDPNPANNTSSVTTVVQPASDLVVALAADTNVAAVQEGFNYVITLTNTGISDATSVVLSDTLPAGVTLAGESTDQEATPTVSGNVVSLSLASLPAGSSAELTISVIPTVGPGSTLVDTASATAAQADPSPSNSTATLSLPVRGVSDLAVSASVSSASVNVGQTVTYSIDVTNLGPADEPDAVLSGALPPGLLVDSTSSTQGADPPVSQGLLSADLGVLPAGDTAVVTLVVTPGVANQGPLTCGFSIQGQDYDPDLSNNTASATVDVEPTSDLSVQIMPGAAPAAVGLDWSYVVQVVNNGPSAAAGVVATIPLPADASFVSASASQQGALTQQGSDLVADLGALASRATATITVVIDPLASSAGGSITLTAGVSGAEYDPNQSNNLASVAVSINASVDLAVALSQTPQQVLSGQDLTFIATVTNLGSTPATGVTLAMPDISGLTLVSTNATQGVMAMSQGVCIASLGDLAPGATADVTMIDMAPSPGTFTQTASLSQDEINLNTATSGTSATATAQVAESPGTVQFATTTVEVTDQAGVAVFPIVRQFGAAGTITVQYSTAAIDAVAGVDFTPASGTLTLGPGQTSATIQVPVLDDIYQNHDDYVSLVIDNPTGGAVLGPNTSATLHIQDVDPDVTPPVVTGLTWSGTSRSIQNLTLTFSEPLDPAFATDASDFRLTRQDNGQAFAIASISYDAASDSITITPQAPLPSGQYIQLLVLGTGADAIRDLAGNVLDGDGNGNPGSNYQVLFAQGNRLTYRDNLGNSVKLRIKGAGYLDQVLSAGGEGISLALEDMVPHHTTLTGSIKTRKGGTKVTELGTISGLGTWGQVNVTLKSPPFQVTQLPFQRRGKFVL